MQPNDRRSHRLTRMSMRKNRPFKLLACVILCWVWAEVISGGGARATAQVAGGAPTTLTDRDVEVTISSFALEPNGFYAWRIEVRRLGPNAVVSDDTKYYVTYRINPDMAGYIQANTTTTLTIPAGASSGSTDLIMSRLISGNIPYGDFLVTTDGSQGSADRPELLARMWYPVNGLFEFSPKFTHDVLSMVFTGEGVLDDSRIGFARHMQGSTNLRHRTQPGFQIVDGVVPPGVQVSQHLLFEESSRLKLDTLENAERTLPLARRGMSPDLLVFHTQRGLELSPLNNLPDNWQAWTMVDYLFLSVEDLAVLAKDYPRKLNAIRDWLYFGGRLVVTDCGDDFSKVNQIFPRLFSGTARVQDSQSPAIWLLPQDNPVNGVVNEMSRFLDAKHELFRTGTNLATLSRTEQAKILSRIASFTQENLLAIARRQTVVGWGHRLDPLEPIAEQLGATKVIWSDLMNGRVLAVPTDLTQFQQNDWLALIALGEVQRDKRSWDASLRHDFEGKELKKFEIAGVGEAPRALFLGLVCLFSFVVGPVCFIVLNRYHRVHFLLAIVPLLSLVSTLGLVIYGLLVDGLHVRMHVLSSSHLDSRNGIVVTQSQYAVYSGSSPLFYESDSRFQLISRSDSRKNTRFRTYHDEELNRISGGKIRTRTQHQVMTRGIQETAKTVSIVPESSRVGELDPSKIVVSHSLGAPLEFIVAHVKGRYLIAEQVPDSTPTAFREITLAKLNDRFTTLYEEALKANGLSQEATMKDRLYSPSNELRFWGKVGEDLLKMDKNFLSPQTDAPFRDGEYWIVTRQPAFTPELKPEATTLYQMHIIHGQW